MRDDNSPDDTVYIRSLPLQLHQHLKEREVFSAADMSLMNLVKTHKESRAIASNLNCADK